MTDGPPPTLDPRRVAIFKETLAAMYREGSVYLTYFWWTGLATVVAPVMLAILQPRQLVAVIVFIAVTVVAFLLMIFYGVLSVRQAYQRASARGKAS